MKNSISLTFVVVLLALVAPSFGIQTFSSIFKTLGTFKTKTYMYTDGFEVTWNDAYTFCHANEMNLAMIDSKEEETILFSLLDQKRVNGNIYVGGSRVGTVAGEWHWVKNDKKLFSSPKWFPGKPGGSGDCLAIKRTTSNVGFSNLRCLSDNANFICQYV